MITVYIWNYRGSNEAWGHASVRVGTTYISWWPEVPGQVPSKWSNDIYASQPFRNRTYQEDVRDEQQKPDHTILLKGLNEAAIMKWWRSFGLLAGPLPVWHTTEQNCSTVTARALRTGGGDNYSTWWKSWNVVWTPSDVLDYTLSIQRGLVSKR